MLGDDIDLPLRDRSTAGRALATALAGQYADEDPLVLALPRGGVPVAFEIADQLGATLDIMLVRKLGVPGHAELAAGAIASGGVRILNRDIIRNLGVSDRAIDAVAAAEQRELERRERVYRGDQPRPELAGRVVILVDDGVATGATMRAAIAALRKSRPARVVVAVPVGAPDTVRVLEREADHVVCLATPSPFWAIGQWYQDFNQTSDEQVRQLLAAAQHSSTAASTPGHPRVGDKPGSRL
ncbi:phosphoribosyltransferase [Enhygromyxa salina]|uniref:Putative phosphoribosyl transferase n=1 Tax=Enhygromyxa salina TaxID=215803 RepID=A0A2S9YY16_9BACT|nr:phosphoribosyltransferase family protein [Enhygromyxa salina]PRQ09986.1 putative phosphoribosyl transferase [Enhygromyxa salina]